MNDFIIFLSEHGLIEVFRDRMRAYSQIIGGGPTTFNELYGATNKEDYINRAFEWDRTIEKHGFWNKMHAKWVQRCKIRKIIDEKNEFIKAAIINDDSKYIDASDVLWG